MRNNRTVVVAASAATLVALACGTAHAAPSEPPPPGDVLHTEIAPGIGYSGSTVDQSVVVTTPFGSLTTRANNFQVLDSQGALVAGTPLTAGAEGEWPEAARPNIDGADVVVPGVVDAADDLAPLEVVDPAAEFNGALGVAATQFGLAVGVGTLAGGVIGMGVGCLGGALTGGFVALPTGPIAAPAALFGCILGASVGAGLGGITGAALLGIPVGVASAVQMYNALNPAAGS